MGGKSSKAPPAPDPWQTAMSQLMLNENTALATGALNRINEYTPWGNVVYSATPGAGPATSAPAAAPALPAPTPAAPRAAQAGVNWATGQVYQPSAPAAPAAQQPATAQRPAGSINYNAPSLFSRTITLNPEEQKLLDKQRQGSNALADTALAQLGRVNQSLSAPLTYDTAMDALMSRLEPQFARDREGLQAELMARGVMPGSEAWNRDMDELNRARTDARTANLGQAIQMAAALRQMPLNEYSALMSQGQVQGPQVGAAPQVGIQTPDYQGAVNQSYQAKLAQWQADQNRSNSFMGGLFGLGGSVLGAGMMPGGFFGL